MSAIQQIIASYKSIVSVFTRRWVRANNFQNVSRVSYGAGISVCVGLNASMSVSSDGLNYTQITLPVNVGNVTLNDVMFDGTRWIAVGNAGTLLVSSDATATSWSLVDTSFSALNFSCIASNGSIYVIGNTVGTTVTTTSDLVTFTSRTTTGGIPKERIIWGGGLFIAVGANATTGQISRSTDGITWINVAVGPAGGLNDIAFNGTMWVTMAINAATPIYSSPDGITWTTRVSPAAGKISIAWSNGVGKFVVSTNAGVYTSVDGTTWVNVYATGTAITPGMLTGAGLEIWAVSDAARAAPSTTTNGSSWKTSYSQAGVASSFMYSPASYYASQTNGAVSIPVCAAFPAGGALMMAGPHALVSTNGDTWTHGSGMTYAAGTYPNAIATPLFLIAGINTTTGSILVSVDGGLSWVARTTALTQAIKTGAGNDSISCVASTTGQISTSPTGTTWTTSTSGVTSITAMVWDGTYFVAMGSGLTTRSTTGTGAWSTSGATTTGITTVNRAVWTGTAIIAVGITGAIKRSTDHGATWSNPTTNPAGTNTLYSIAHDPDTNTTIIVGALTNTVYRSTDHGVTWSAVGLGRTMPTINNVVWTGTKFIITCTYGRIISSVDGLTWDGGPSYAYIPTQNSATNSTPSVTYQNGKWWAPITAGTGQIMTASDPSLPWSQSTTANGYYAQKIIYANGQYVIGASNAAKEVTVQTSSTLTNLPTIAAGGASLGGITFASFTTGMTVTGLLYDGTNYIMSVTNTTTTDGWIWTSPDAITWTNRGVRNPTYFLGEGNGVLIAGRYSGISTSTDNGVTWTIRYAATGAWPSGAVAYSGSQYVVAGNGKVLVSSDAITWTTRTFTGSTSATSVIFDGEVFIVLCGNSNSVYSVDGTTWTPFAWPTSNTPGYSIVYDGVNYMSVATGKDQVMRLEKS